MRGVERRRLRRKRLAMAGRIVKAESGPGGRSASRQFKPQRNIRGRRIIAKNRYSSLHTCFYMLIESYCRLRSLACNFMGQIQPVDMLLRQHLPLQTPASPTGNSACGFVSSSFRRRSWQSISEPSQRSLGSLLQNTIVWNTESIASYLETLKTFLP